MGFTGSTPKSAGRKGMKQAARNHLTHGAKV